MKLQVAGLKVTFERTIFPAYAVFGAIPVIVRLGYSLITRRGERDARSWAMVPLLGVCFVASHIVGQFIHQIGHALAAWINARPMTGVRYDYIFSFSEYPADEPASPPHVHIQRSLGGLVAALVIFAGVVSQWSRARRATGWFPRWVYGVVLADSLLIITGTVLSDVMYVVQRGWIEQERESPSS